MATDMFANLWSDVQTGLSNIASQAGNIADTAINNAMGSNSQPTTVSPQASAQPTSLATMVNNPMLLIGGGVLLVVLMVVLSRK